MTKLTGRFNYHVFVDCPNDNCQSLIDLVDLQEESELAVLFGGENTTGKWNDLGLEFTCPECGEEFELDRIEY